MNCEIEQKIENKWNLAKIGQKSKDMKIKSDALQFTEI